VVPQNDKEQVQATQGVHKSRTPGLPGSAQNCLHNENYFPYMQNRGASGAALGSGTVPQDMMFRVRFPVGSLDIFR
jgi:hypothetical protein